MPGWAGWKAARASKSGSTVQPLTIPTASRPLTTPVTFTEAALGADISVPTLDGTPVTLRVPAGTPFGQTFRVKGRGVPKRDGNAGDLLVTVQVAVRQRVSGAAKEALEAYRDATAGDDPRADLFLEAAR